MFYVAAITRTVAIGVLVLPSLLLWYLSLTIAKSHGDPARQWINFLRGALAFMVLGTSFFTIVGTLRLSVTGLEMLPYEVWGIVHSVMALLATLFLHATYIFVFSTSVETAVAINIIRNGPLTPPLRAVRNFAQALCVILALLSIISFALYLRVIIGNDATLGRTVTRLTAAITVMLLVNAVLTLPFSVALITRATYPQDARQPAILLVVCNVLNIIPHAFEVAYLAQYGGFGGPALNYVEPWLSILAPIVAWWSPFLLLAILFSLAIKRTNGVWSIQPPMSPIFKYQQYACDVAEQQHQQSWYNQSSQHTSPYGCNEPYELQPNNMEWQRPISPARPSAFATLKHYASATTTRLQPRSPSPKKDRRGSE